MHVVLIHLIRCCSRDWSKKYFMKLSWKKNLSFSSTASISFIIINWLLMTSDHLMSLQKLISGTGVSYS